MTAQQCRDEIQKILDKACPELMMEVYGDRTQLYTQHCMGRISYHFYIDYTEWEKAKWPEHLVKIRLHDTLLNLRDCIDRTIKEIE